MLYLSVHQLKNDITEDIKRVREILEDQSRSLTAKQRSIMMTQRLSAIEEVGNFEYPYTNLNVNERADVLETGLKQLASLPAFDSATTDHATWGKLESARNSFINGLVEYWGSAGVLRNQGTSDAFDSMLKGAEILPLDTFLIKEAKRDELIERYNVALDYCVNTADTFFTVCTEIHSISQKQLVEWGQKALRANADFLYLVRKYWSIPTHYNLSVDEPEQFHQRFVATASPFLRMIRGILHLNSRLGDDWPPTLSAYRFLRTDTGDALLKSLQGLQNELDSLIEDYLYNVDKTFDVNEKPLEMPEVQRLLREAKASKMVLQGLTFNHSVITWRAKEDLKGLRALIEEIHSFLEEISDILEDPETFSEELTFNFHEHLGYFIFLVGLWVTVSPLIPPRDVQTDLRLREAFRNLLSEEGQKQHPMLHYMLLLTSLTLASKLGDRGKMLENAEALIEHSKNLSLHPRHMFSCALLGHLTRLVLRKEQPEEFFMHVKFNLDFVRGFLSHRVIQDIEEYITTVGQAIKRELATYSLTRLDASPFDPFSVCVPDFRDYGREAGFGTIMYLPFNLHRDAIY